MTNQDIEKQLIRTLNSVKECKQQIMISKSTNESFLYSLLRQQENRIKELERIKNETK